MKFDILLLVCRQDVSSTNKPQNLYKKGLEPIYVSYHQTDLTRIVKKNEYSFFYPHALSIHPNADIYGLGN